MAGFRRNSVHYGYSIDAHHTSVSCLKIFFFVWWPLYQQPTEPTCLPNATKNIHTKTTKTKTNSVDTYHMTFFAVLYITKNWKLFCSSSGKIWYGIRKKNMYLFSLQHLIQHSLPILADTNTRSVQSLTLIHIFFVLVFFFSVLRTEALPGHSCHVHGKKVPSWRSYWPACNPNSTCPNYSHTSKNDQRKKKFV